MPNMILHDNLNSFCIYFTLPISPYGMGQWTPRVDGSIFCLLQDSQRYDAEGCCLVCVPKSQ